MTEVSLETGAGHTISLEPSFYLRKAVSQLLAGKLDGRLKGGDGTVQGKTHVVVGIAASTLLLRPVGVASFAATAVAGAVGGLLPDVDLLKSNGSKEISKCAGAVFCAAAALVLIDCAAPYGMAGLLTLSEGPLCLPGAVWLLVLIAIGVSRPHREFTHSLAFCALIAAGIFATCPYAATPVAIGILSHLAIDALNRRGMALFWPVKKRFCLALCSSGRAVDAGLCLVAAFVIALYVLAWAGLIRF